jgi:hypothetical protein
MSQNSIKNFFWVVLDFFSNKNGPHDLVWGLFSSIDIGTYIATTCWLSSTFLCPFRGAQMPHNRMELFLVLDYFFYKNGPNDLIRGSFSSLDIETYFLPTYRPSSTFLVSFGGAQMPQNSIKSLFSGCSELFLLQEWAS